MDINKNEMDLLCDKFIGMDYIEFKSEFKDNYPDLNYRLVMKDNNPFIVTCDFRMDRFNIYTENNIIVKCNLG